MCFSTSGLCVALTCQIAGAATAAATVVDRELAVANGSPQVIVGDKGTSYRPFRPRATTGARMAEIMGEDGVILLRGQRRERCGARALGARQQQRQQQNKQQQHQKQQQRQQQQAIVCDMAIGCELGYSAHLST